MVFKKKNEFSEEIIEKAGYNQAQRITETLAMLRNSYVSAMIDDDYSAALKVCRRVLDIISAKMKLEDINKMNDKIYLIKRAMPLAEETYLNLNIRYYKNSYSRIKMEKDIENLWRDIEKLQDEHGYGMLAEEEYGL